MPRKYSKKTRKQSGGAASSPNGDSYTQDDVEEFFQEILKRPKSGYYAWEDTLNIKFFEYGKGAGASARHETTLIPKWNKMINECFNLRGQTPLYVALRFGAHDEMINILLKNIVDVNRKNKDSNDTPLFGLCWGPDNNAKINFIDTTARINQLCFKHGANLRIGDNNYLPLDILAIRAKRNLLDFTP